MKNRLDYADVLKYYEAQKGGERVEYDKLKRELSIISWGRLFLFISCIILIWWRWGNTIDIAIIFTITVALFAVLIKKGVQLEFSKNLKEKLIEVLNNEIEAVNNQYSSFDTGKDFSQGDHPFSYDLDVFGKNSLYQKIVRCGTNSGKRTLANLLSIPNFNKSDILAKQEAIRELRDKVNWRQELNALGNLIGLSSQQESDLNKWLETPIDAVKGKFYSLLVYATPVYSITSLILYLFDIFSFPLFLALLTLPLAITGRNLRAINAQMNSTDKQFKVLKTYARLFESIEGQTFDSPLLKSLRLQLYKENSSASIQINHLGKIFEAFENRNNILVGVVLNAFFLWDIRQVKRIENWQLNHQVDLKEWMDTVAQIECLSSFANLSFNHPEYTFPQLSEIPFQYNFEDMGHPMIPSEKRVSNSYSIKGLSNFSIVTGANMAGKSTFLRTVGINLILAMTGAPVCATRFVFEPVQLFSSMRTDDSLTDQESYFFSELKRLKQIISALEDGQKLFIILDEILKGTNSKDKAEGSRKFMEKLLKTNSMGIIATHDLSLCEMENDFPQSISNYAFEVEFRNNELQFDYKLRKGICQNMNASFLLNKMGLVD